jgi:predicted alpha-1,2-mannosidase
MKKIILFVVLFPVFFVSAQSNQQGVFEPIGFVNPLMGTDSKFSMSNGNTYPAIALPWGMNFWSPQTGKMGDGWMYSYDADKIRGIKQTHQPSPWINDYGQFSLSAVTGKPVYKEEERQSWFSHKSEIARPNYYSIYLADYDVTAEVTPTERAAIFQFTFPENDSSFVLIDAFNKGSSVKIIPKENKVIGWTTRNSGGVPKNFKNYFVAVFDHSFNAFYTWKDSTLTLSEKEAEGFHTGAILQFKTQRGERIGVKVASSFISAEQAQLNLDREVGNKTFGQVKADGEKIWNNELGKIKIYDSNIDHIRTFYSCLYRVLLFPRKFYEINTTNDTIHYSPFNGQVLPGVIYTDNGFWDTFRAVFPFFTLMYPEHDVLIMQGLVNAYKESGWLPEWASPGHRDCMIGSNSASLIADSYIKGIRGYDINALYEAILKNTKGNGPVSSVGRLGADYYNNLGYIPYDVGINENTARTLEYAYADFCISELAKALGRPKEEIELFQKRAQNYRNVFDTGSLLMRGRNKDGVFQSPFSPYKWGDAFTEGNSWHYTWSVFHDIEGLKQMMGGDEPFIQMLDSVFIVPPVYDCSYYGYPIHEITEMQVAGMGNYAHGNQPIQHMIYLYNYAGKPWKTQQHVREVLLRLYQPIPDGYCGDEDNGQTSAWYVFSSLGFYPVCPGRPEYVIGSPLFDKAELLLPNGRKLTIGAKGAGTGRYIQSALLNGKPLNHSFLTQKQLLDGGKLEFFMGEKPNLKLWAEPESYPSSVTKVRK